ncbi:MAG TPA: DUF1203 domain-containing protein [Chloroflexia bacterium]|nr:DUF1203 domain-containing protein [Chloroflexia bacterium]
MSFRIVPLQTTYLELVRQQQVDALGQNVRRLVSAEGGEPCRDVLRRARPGEELILASYSPFTRPGPYREFGPIFVLANPASDNLTFDSSIFTSGSDYFSSQLVLRAYSRDEDMLEAQLVAKEEVSTVLSEFFQKPQVAFVHARFPAAGCFALRIERVEATAS